MCCIMVERKKVKGKSKLFVLICDGAKGSPTSQISAIIIPLMVWVLKK